MPTQIAMVTSSALPRTNARPARIAGQNASRVSEACSTTRTPRRIAADAISSAASANSAAGGPTTLISAPATPGPMTSAAELASAFLAWASTRRSRGTIWVSTICAALPAIV